MGQAALHTLTKPPSPIIPREMCALGAIAARGHTGAAEYVGLLGWVGVGVGNLTIVVTVETRLGSPPA